jgi:alpha-tubulin suppressor-like RCC1 family protein
VGCTGYNLYGELGEGTTTNRAAPVTVAGAQGATRITAGYDHACAVVAGGVRCWGRNEHLQLGASTTATCGSSRCSTSPVTVPGVTDAVQVVAGLAYSCALLRDGTVRCWGDNASGQMGIGTMGGGDRGVTAVPGLSDVVQRAGGYQQVCAVLRDGTVRCWGGNSYGNLLDTGAGRPSPTPLPGLTGVAQLAMSVYHACARLNDGALRCWGYNNFRQIGDGTTTPRAVLTTPTGLPAVADVAVGYWLTCARTASRQVWCWGWNLSGGVGDGTSGGNRTTPVRTAP